MLSAIARGCHKNLLIFNTSSEAAYPIYIIQATQFGGFLNSDIPVVLGYNQVHYESFHPMTEEDVVKTKHLVQSFIEGKYSLSKKDIPLLTLSSESQFEIDVNDSGYYKLKRKVTSETYNEENEMNIENRNMGSFSFINYNLEINIVENISGGLMCPFCNQEFKRIKSHFLQSKVCKGKVEMKKFEESYENFQKEIKRNQMRERRGKLSKDEKQENKEKNKLEQRTARKNLSKEQKQKIRQREQSGQRNSRKNLSKKEKQRLREKG